jgi:biotin synthesis protein BioG
MKHEWVIREGHERLILFFAGWGMDARPFRRIEAVASDVLVLFAYHEETGSRGQGSGDRSQETGDRALADACAGYARCDVLAWSLGVVMAGHWCNAGGVPVSQVIAVNGTVYPAHDEKGIPCDRFDGTLAGLSTWSLQQFRRRMCGRPEVLKQFLGAAPSRDVDDLRRELAFLRNQPACPESVFTRAVVSSRDRIVPPENQRRCWGEAGVPFHDIDGPHYLFDKDTHWEAVLDARNGA